MSRSSRRKIVSHPLRWARTIFIVHPFFTAIAFVESWYKYQRVINIPSSNTCVITISLYKEGTEIETWEIQERSHKEYFLNMISQLKYDGLFFMMGSSLLLLKEKVLITPSMLRFRPREVMEHGFYWEGTVNIMMCWAHLHLTLFTCDTVIQKNCF